MKGRKQERAEINKIENRQVVIKPKVGSLKTTKLINNWPD